MQKRLTEVEAELEEHDRDAFYDLMAQEMELATSILDKLRYGCAENEGVDPNIIASQLHINVDRFRSVEGLFQPTAILGIDQAGLIECIEDLLKQFSPDDAQLLAENIFICGGMSQIPGLEERLSTELRMIRPVDSKLSLSFAQNPNLDAWKGAASLIKDYSRSLPWITKEWYQEHGCERLPFYSCFTNQF